MARIPIRRLAVAPVLAALALSLSGCLWAAIPSEYIGFADADEETSTPDSEPQAAGDWNVLPSCEVDDATAWVLLDDFPRKQVEDAELFPVCGDIWHPLGEEAFASIALDSVGVDQLEEMGSLLEDAGYELSFDDFDPEASSDEGYYGARDYYLNGDDSPGFTRVALEIYPSDEEPGEWTVYVDYLAPSTRELTKSSV
ncbi:hypothetical protein [Microbacterium sp.]|uniref:hypothetical protein n=1 Tax=Microbacterium sp. TaxID=51671 RepID=UPI00333E816E